MTYITFFALLIFFTYGMCGSLLMLPVRTFLGGFTSGFVGLLVTSLIYCPVCFGTWVAVVLWARGMWTPITLTANSWSLLECVACAVTVLIFAKDWLATPLFDAEQEMITEARAKRGVS